MQSKSFLKAKPIYAKNLEKEMNISLFFVYEGYLEKGTILKITGNSDYRIFDNGVFLGVGPARAARNYFRIDEFVVDESKFHRFVIELSGYCCNSYYYVNSLPFIQAEFVKDNDVIAYTSDSNFKCYRNTSRYQKVVRYSFQRTFSESYHFEENIVNFYKNKEKTLGFPELDIQVFASFNYLPRGVNYPSYSELTLNKIEEGHFVLDPNKKIYDDRYMHLEHLKVFPINEWEVDPNAYISQLTYQAEKIGALKSGCFETYVLNTSKTGFVKFSLTALEDSEIYFIFDEIDSKEEKGAIDLKFYRNTTHNIVSYELKKGTYEHMFFEPYTVKYLRVIVKKGVIKINSLSFVLFENPNTNRLSYDFKNPKIQKIADAAVSTFAQNAVDILTDCPSRERAGWLYDSYFTAMAEKLITGENKVEHNFLENYALSEESDMLPKGMIHMCYPSDCSDGVFIPNWSLFYILELQQYLLRTGDEKLIQRSLPKVKGILSYFSEFENEFGLLEDLKSWIMVEWSKANDPDHVCGVNIPTNMLYSAALHAAGVLLKDDTLVQKSNHLNEVINNISFDGTFYVDNLIRNEEHQLIKTSNLTETCQYYAFFCNVTTKEERPELYHLLLTQFGPSRDYQHSFSDVEKSNVIPGYFMRLLMLMEYKEYEQCKKEVVQYFYEMSEITGTLWEHYSTWASLNHGLCSAVLCIIFEFTKALEK